MLQHGVSGPGIEMVLTKRVMGLVRLRNYSISAMLVGILWLWVSPSAGYMLKGPHILDLMANKLATVQTLMVDQRVIIEDRDISEEPFELRETLRYIYPDRFRSDMRHGEAHRIYIHAQGRTLNILDEAITGEQSGRYDRYKDLLLYRSRHALHKVLSIHGVDVGITSLGQMGDRIVYVIGATYPDASVSQVWVDKERLIPLRWINVFPAEAGSTDPERLEFVYGNWQNTDGVWYPMQIETFHNQKSVRQIRVTKVQANTVISAELLDIDYLKAIYKEQDSTLPAGESSRPDVDDVQQTIEDFRKKFEP